MKLFNIILAASILMLLVGSGQAIPTYGQIKMRAGANITLDGGYLKGDSGAYSQLSSSTGSITVGPYTDFNAKFYRAMTYGTDDDVVINNTLTYAERLPHRPDVVLATGNYNFSSTGQIIIPGWMKLQGKGGGGSEGPLNHSAYGGTTIQVYGTTKSPIKVNNGSSVIGISAWYPLQKTNSTPTDYPAFIMSDTNRAVDITISDINLGNAYRGITMDGTTSGRIDISNIKGYPLFRGIVINHINDFTTVQNVKFTPSYGWNRGIVLETWVQDNGIGIYADNVGWINFDNINVFSYKYGFFANLMSSCRLTNSEFDACSYPISINGASSRNVIQNNIMIGYQFWGASPYLLRTALSVAGDFNSISSNVLSSQGNGIDVWGDHNSVYGNTISPFGICDQVNSVGIYFPPGSDYNINGTNIIDGGGNSNTYGTYNSGIGNVKSGANLIIDCTYNT
jgi:hypothetical protein